MTTYSILLTDGYRVDCKGKRIGQAMRELAKSRPNLIPIMTPSFITYINGVSLYGFRQSVESSKALEVIQKKYARSE